MQWLFLRGAWDNKTEKSIESQDDMWLDLFVEITNLSNNESERCDVFFRDVNYFFNNNTEIKRKLIGWDSGMYGNKQRVALEYFGGTKYSDWKPYTHIFARGGFDYYDPILKQYPDAYKIYYGAGRRFCPSPTSPVNYDLIICDTFVQESIIKFVHPNSKTWVWKKPAANIFTPIANVNKRYDVCYIANGEQAHFKGVEWVYDTCPRDLKILHLGTKSKYKPPENVTCFHAPRVDMPNLINQCHIGIVPYWNKIDSCPRVIPEMLSCGLPLVVSDELNGMEYMYNICYNRKTKKDFWQTVRSVLNDMQTNSAPYRLILDKYREVVNVNSVAKELLRIISNDNTNKI